MKEPFDNPTQPSDSPDQRAGAHADDAKRAAEDVRAKAEEAWSDTKAQAAEAGEQVKDKARQAAADARQKGEQYLDEKKTRVAEEIRVYSDAARRAADKLSEDSDTNLARYVSSAADYLDRFGSRIDERGVTELVDDVRTLARRRPEIFYGGMFVAGLAAARFLKASADRRRDDQMISTYEPRAPRYSPPPAPSYPTSPAVADTEVVVPPADVSNPIGDLSKEGY